MVQSVFICFQILKPEAATELATERGIEINLKYCIAQTEVYRKVVHDNNVKS